MVMPQRIRMAAAPVIINQSASFKRSSSRMLLGDLNDNPRQRDAMLSSSPILAQQLRSGIIRMLKLWTGFAIA